MGLINLEPTLHEGEQIIWRRPAALSLSNRVVAGVLYLTSEAVLFMPNRFNRQRDIVSTRVPLEQLTGVDTAAPVMSLASRRNGGMRRRLRIATHEEAYAFVINHPDEVARELRAVLRESPEQA